ncbi:MAG TPA: dihydroorotate dehydrogenase-like protein [Salinivirgaceae bacterium]|nr:dihydroorotate dehydrogenase-like protein [Salinivirgaceae bacterium]
MIDLTTTYMGLHLKNPLIVGSSGLTADFDDVMEIAMQGPGAIVLKSLFEEEIQYELEQDMLQMTARPYVYPETFDYMDSTLKKDRIREYLELIQNLKSATDVPIIASINCVSDQKWTYLAKEIEAAGADGLELNLFILPSDLNRSSEDMEQVYFSVIRKVRENTNLPIAVKISYYFNNLAQFIKKLSLEKIEAIVLFNRFYSPDIDIENFEITSGNVLSTSGDISMPLRWIAMMSGRVNCDLAASTGVSSGSDMVKLLLAGATATQVVSELYRSGNVTIKLMLKDLENWMVRKKFESISDFRGKLAQTESTDPAAYERAQFMRHFSNFIRYNP